jgi:hypothetical protein
MNPGINLENVPANIKNLKIRQKKDRKNKQDIKARVDKHLIISYI